MSKRSTKARKTKKIDYSKPAPIPVISQQKYRFSDDPRIEYRSEESANIERVTDDRGLALRFKRRFNKQDDGSWIPSEEFILSVYSWTNRVLCIKSLGTSADQVVQHKDHILKFVSSIKSKETANWIWSLVKKRGATFEHLKDILAPKYLEEVFEIAE